MNSSRKNNTLRASSTDEHRLKRTGLSVFICVHPWPKSVWSDFLSSLFSLESIFASRFQITRQDLESHLAEALSAGGDYADLYFEYLLTSSIGIDESMVKSAAQGVSVGLACA
jgi:hypothetical protein